jgi:RNA 2',3'-cyclic 3'-phosphodiesterase
MMRLFAAIEIPETHRLRLSMVAGPLPGAKWIDREDMHLTLRFAGDIDNRTASDFADHLARIDVAPFDVRFTELGAFGGREPRTIHAGIDGGERLEALQRATDRAARAAGIAAEPRTYKPHVTLARLRGTSSDIVARFLTSRARLDLPPFTVDHFVLYSSKPKVGGGPYVVEEVFGMG